MDIRKITLPFLISFLLGQVQPDSVQWVESISASAFCGPASILLTWEIPDKVDASLVRILRSDDINGPFQLINETNEKDFDRFLDKYLDEEERYFYIIEVISEKGEHFSTNRTTPVFERLDVFSTFHKPENVETHPVTPFDLILKEAVNFGSMLEENVFKGLLADSIALNAGTFLELIPLEYIPRLSHWLVDVSDTAFVAHMKRINDSSAVLFRNNVLLTPAEWDREFESASDHFQKKASKMKAVLNDVLYFIEGLPVLFLSGIKNSGDSLIIKVTDLNLREEYSSRMIMDLGDGLSEVEFYPGDMNFGQTATFSVEYSGDADSIYITFHNEPETSFVIPPAGHAVNYTLNGSTRITDELQSLSFGPGITGLVLNELFYSEGTIAIELFGETDLFDRYIVSIDDSAVWEIETFYPEADGFIDSTFILDTLDPVPHIVHLSRVGQDDKLKLVESFLVRGTLLTGKIPDGGKWTRLQSMSVGKTNMNRIAVKAAPDIPELFALYQNYPNPFNGETRLSFDLLQESKVNLYVSDALGHIVDRFIVDEVMTKGNYNFTWEGGSHSSGIYFFTLSAEVSGYQPVVFSRKMIYMK